jgi:hypothetical protein
MKHLQKKTETSGITNAVRFSLRNGIVSIKEFLGKGLGELIIQSSENRNAEKPKAHTSIPKI